MTPRIDPHLPLVWRSPRELQLGGIRPRAVLVDPDALATGLLAALRHGARRSTLHAIGEGLGGTAAAVDALLEVLRPAFEPDPEAGPADESTGGPGQGGPTSSSAERDRARASTESARRSLIAFDGDSPIADRIAEGLEALGHRTVAAAGTDADRVALAVLVAGWVVPPAAQLPWLRADVPHLAVVLDDDGAEVGPLVEPGAGPCLRCRELARRDADTAWPAIAAQLAGRPMQLGRPRAEFDAVARAVAAADDRIRLGRNPLVASSVAISADGSTTTRSYSPHPDCGCRAPGGTATAPVRLDAHRPAGSSSVRADAVPA